MVLSYTKTNNIMSHNQHQLDSNIIQFKLDRNEQIAHALNIKHVDNFIYADDDLMRYFSFPLYELMEIIHLFYDEK